MQTLDLSGLSCPLPILKTKQALAKMSIGESLTVISTDPHSEIDFKAFISKTDHQLISFKEEGTTFIFEIKK